MSGSGTEKNVSGTMAFAPSEVAAPPKTLITPTLFSQPPPRLTGRRGRTARPLINPTLFLPSPSPRTGEKRETIPPS